MMFRNILGILFLLIFLNGCYQDNYMRVLDQSLDADTIIPQFNYNKQDEMTIGKFDFEYMEQKFVLQYEKISSVHDTSLILFNAETNERIVLWECQDYQHILDICISKDHQNVFFIISDILPVFINNRILYQYNIQEKKISYGNRSLPVNSGSCIINTCPILNVLESIGTTLNLDGGPSYEKVYRIRYGLQEDSCLCLDKWRKGYYDSAARCW